MKKVMKNPIRVFFSKNDIEQIGRLGLDLKDVKRQLEIYRQGAMYFKLDRPCSVNDGIIFLAPEQRKKLISFYERESGKYKLIKFVPASGAASRMFSEWFSVMEIGGFDSPAPNREFFRDLKKYPFYPLLAQDKRALKVITKKNIKSLLDYILSPNGLNFGWLPKALIPFHCYDKVGMRTALEEHVFEAAQYVRSAGDVCHLHFTVSEEHQKEIIKKIRAVKSLYEKLCGVTYKISFSIQSPSSNKLAVDDHNLPVRDKKGRLVFRPGGHGSLLKNLQDLDADLIFVKNIDNVSPERLLKKNLPYKKMLGGLALKMRQEIFSILRQLENNETESRQIEIIKKYCSELFNITFPRGFSRQSLTIQKKIVRSLLDRPFRVCGMVKNDGEPGGAPFWVQESNGCRTLQIVESGHVNKNSAKQKAVWSRAGYFNPVDMVCCTKNYKGEKFDLDHYVNPDAYLITMKNEKGLSLKALEAPGLWNGAMAYWNTVFVELPNIVFNPVKTVNDLLRAEHLIK
jgi:hypothetical protein